MHFHVLLNNGNGKQWKSEALLLCICIVKCIQGFCIKQMFSKLALLHSNMLMYFSDAVCQLIYSESIPNASIQKQFQYLLSTYLF